MLEILLRHLQHISAVSKEHITPFTVFCHVLELAFLEFFQLGII